MPRWTKEELNEYQTRRASRGPQPQQSIFNEPVGAASREEGHAARVHVCITSFRRRLIDPDNLCPKYFIDCLRYAELIKGDSADQITVEIKQFKVDFKFDERTEIELS